MTKSLILSFLPLITLSAESNILDTNTSTPIQAQSIRSILGADDPIKHAQGQLRTGYISFSEHAHTRTQSYAMGGHFHIDSKRWNGLKIGASLYTVLNLGIHQNPLHTSTNFFDEDKNSFILLSKGFIDGRWGQTEIKLGRQTLDTPHADSDDLRMMPNFFTAYTIINNDIEDLTLMAGQIDKMAGEGNGINTPEFVDVGETLGTQKIQGVYYASAAYEGFKDVSLSLWYYHYSDIAEVLYTEVGYQYSVSKEAIFTLGLQYDYSHGTGMELLGQQDSHTYGISIQGQFDTLGLSILAAYNQDNGATGATGLSLGGGPFFTSMEDQTLDAVGRSGFAWILGANYDLEKLGIKNLTVGLAHGHFEADDSSFYHSDETDALLEYSWSETFFITAAFASVNHNVAQSEDYKQFRLIANYNF